MSTGRFCFNKQTSKFNYYNSGAGGTKWLPLGNNIALRELSDNLPVGPGTDTYAVTWDNGTGTFTLSPSGGGGATRFQDLTDVTADFATTPDGYVPTFDIGTGKLVMAAGGGGGGSGLGVAFARFNASPTSGIVIRTFDSTAGDAFTSSYGITTVGPVLPFPTGGNPVFDIPAGCQYAQIIGVCSTQDHFTGYIFARILRYQPGLPSPLVPASSAYSAATDGNGSYATIIGDGSSYGIVPLDTGFIEVSPGDQIAIDVVASSGITQFTVDHISIIGWGTGSNFSGGGGGGGGSTTLAGLTDVDLTGAVNGDSLVLNAGDGKWEPKYIPTFFKGIGAPSNGLGLDGDFYFDPTNGIFYGPKASGAWPGGITLPAGLASFAGVSFAVGAPAAIYSVGASWGGAPHFEVPASGVDYVTVTFQLHLSLTVGVSGNSNIVVQQYDSGGTAYGMTCSQTFTCPGAGTFIINLTGSGTCAVAPGDYFAVAPHGGITLTQGLIQVTKVG